MKPKEVAQILDLIQTEYPHSFSALSADQMALKLELWTKEFQGDDARLVYTAVRLLFESGMQFAPNIGDIRKKMQTILQKEELSEQQAWALVSKATKNSGYQAGKEFSKLPPLIQRIVGSPEQLRTWALMEAETVESVVASNFMRSYKAVAAKEKEMSMYPESLKSMISKLQIGEGVVKSLPGKEENVNSN